MDNKNLKSTEMELENAIRWRMKDLGVKKDYSNESITSMFSGKGYYQCFVCSAQGETDLPEGYKHCLDCGRKVVLIHQSENYLGALKGCSPILPVQ
jgi:DNA-directed RNA polymerase subunit RPC12/RpoP